VVDGRAACETAAPAPRYCPARSTRFAARAQDANGANLQIEWCDASSPLQRWTIGGANSAISLAGNASLCVTSEPFGSSQLTNLVRPCDGSPAQAYAYSPTAYTVVNGGFAWNDQWGSADQGAGGFVRLWTTAELSFNSYFFYTPATGQFGVNFTQPGNSTLTQLCVTAVPDGGEERALAGMGGGGGGGGGADGGGVGPDGQPYDYVVGVTMDTPGGTRSTAASSGACRPISTSGRSTGCSAARARESTPAPTFAPQRGLAQPS
jgi:hypothetical protein